MRPLQSTNDFPLFPILLQLEQFLSRVLTLFRAFFHLETKLLDCDSAFSFKMDRAVPRTIVNAIECSEIMFDPVFQMFVIFLFILIGSGNTGEIEGKVLGPQCLFPLAQGSIDAVLFRSLAGKKK